MKDRVSVSIFVTVLPLGYKVIMSKTHVYHIVLHCSILHVERNYMHFMMIAACFYHLDLL